MTGHWPSPVPGQKLIQPLDSMIVDTRQHVGEPGLWIDIVELGGSDEGVDGSGAPAALIGAGERPVSSSDGWPWRPIGDPARDDITLFKRMKHLAAAIQVLSNESQTIHPIQEFSIETSQSIQALVGN